MVGRVEPNLVRSKGAGDIDVAVSQVTSKTGVVVGGRPWERQLVFVKHDHALDAMPGGWQQSFELCEVAHVGGEEDVGWRGVLQLVSPNRRSAVHPPFPVVAGERLEFHAMSPLGESGLDPLAPGGMGPAMKGVQQKNVGGIVHEAKF